MAPFYAQGDQPAGEVLQDVYDRMSPEEQTRILLVARPVPRPSFSREEIQAAAQLFYADVLRIDEEEYGKLLASLLDPRRRECEDDEDPALPLRDNPNFVEDLPPPGPEGDLEILFSIKFFRTISAGRRAATSRFGVLVRATCFLCRRFGRLRVTCCADPYNVRREAPLVVRVWVGRFGGLLAA
ncbi:hypothetical protein [Candidatus Igneacidithiobacillus taiwanensis]|uniref:hypothetical protein n=1 Tax=Candidatus Igneacidithiobacillus taiwanensis TaxID=1945924 RepID=UPI00289ABB70|nr:hypothetical protein [Candidatus Igneacidithiobacillus taiwanensis]